MEVTKEEGDREEVGRVDVKGDRSYLKMPD